MTGFSMIVSVLIMLLQHILAVPGDFTGGNVMQGVSDIAYVLGGIGFLFHLHIKFNFFGISVDTTQQPK